MLSVGSIDPLARSVRANRIVVLLAEHHGPLEMGARAVTVAAQVGNLSELRVRASLHPRPRFDGNRATQVHVRFVDETQRHARRSALLIPERLLAEHPRPPVL